MLLPSKHLFLIFSIATLSVAASASASASDSETLLSNTTTNSYPTAYEVLQGLSLPVGILPQGVQSYLLTPQGTFEVFLSDICEFKVAGKYLLKYKRIIKGSVESGAVTKLKGVSVQILLVWVPITEVRNTGDELIFSIGPISKSFPISDFDESPRCRCNCAGPGRFSRFLHFAGPAREVLGLILR